MSSHVPHLSRHDDDDDDDKFSEMKEHTRKIVAMLCSEQKLE
jgi:hypothetical protein